MHIARPKPPGRFSPERLFRPESVVIIGASQEPGAQIVSNMKQAGFAGPVWALDAEAEIERLEAAPDLAVLTQPETVDPACRRLAAKGCYAAVVVCAAEGLDEIARDTGVRVLGPGSFGIAVPAIGLNASRAHINPPKGKLALVSQSAALCRAVLDWAEPNGVGFSYIIGIGRKADIGFGLALDWLARDPGTSAILLDIRTISDRRLFLSAARAAAQLRPMVAVRSGVRLLDPSGGAEDAFKAALRRAGALQVNGFEDLLSAAETLTRARPVRNECLAIVTNAIGPGSLAADAAVRSGLPLAWLSDQTRQALQTSLPCDLTLANEGIVYTGLQAPSCLAEIAAMLAGSQEVGGVLVVHAPTGPDDSPGMEALVTTAKAVRIPLLVCVMGEITGGPHRRRLAEAGLAVFDAPERAVRGFHDLVQDRRNRAAAAQLPPSTVLALAPDRAGVRRIFSEVRAEGRLSLSQDEALTVLAAYGVPIVPGRVASTPGEAAQGAALLGFPAVVKLRRTSAPDVVERGGIALDLHDEPEVRAEAEELQTKAARAGIPQIGFLVQRQVGRARELLIRVTEDPTFGPIIAFGQGGAAGRVLREVAVDLPPLNLPLAHALIARSPVAKTLGAVHELPAANEEALAETLVRVSQLVIDFPELCELQVNPLFSDAEGVLAADAAIHLRPAADTENRLSITPYPAELEERWNVAGEALVIRPIRPEDAKAHGEAFTRLTPDDVRFRFFSSIRSLPPEQLARLTNIDYDREMALAAVREGPHPEIVGVARLVCETDGRRGEFAIIVDPHVKHKGLATHLMRRLLDWARDRGVEEVVGQVLADNAPMLAFVRRLGFETHRVPDEEDIVEVRLRLNGLRKR
ncbi:MAG: bifunctional acetate--CoA ligase family protein/GNAT family N-acetyltransferase [Acetobacteraceae bacterium]|nr:bifunctional acetate--CoA ligase family protein/GNAT family N-acetyltransferase [Acetobacteraceae bacterium]MBV8521560.1 bifunctional acetate--CoA ligase family protein/GNAT family N-acetyltransferase [Acetobacteraceae bacterium]